MQSIEFKKELNDLIDKAIKSGMNLRDVAVSLKVKKARLDDEIYLTEVQTH